MCYTPLFLQRSGQGPRGSMFWWCQGELQWTAGETVPQRTGMMAQCRIMGCLCLIWKTDQLFGLCRHRKIVAEVGGDKTVIHVFAGISKYYGKFAKKGIKLPLIPCHIRIAAVPDYQEEEPVISMLHKHTAPNLSLFISY